MKKLLTLAISTLVLAGASSIRADEACTCCKPKQASSEAAPEKHPLKGVVRRVNVEKNRISVKHEEIPGFMAAMTMAFKVTAEDVKRLKEGDTITGVLYQKGDEWMLENIEVIASTAK